eukprot:gene3517-21848_t
MLRVHPDLCADHNELHMWNHVPWDYYKCKPETNCWKTIQKIILRYTGKFSKCRGKSFGLDSTPNYVLRIGYLERMAAIYPKVLAPKFVIVVREPVGRALSAFNHQRINMLTTNGKKGYWVSKCRETKPETLDAYLACDKTARDYRVGKAIEYVSKTWGSSQMFVVSRSTLIKNTSDTLQRLASFFEIPLIPEWNSKLPHSNGHPHKTKQSLDDVNCETKAKLHHLFAQDQLLVAALAASPDRPPSQPQYVPEPWNETCTSVVQRAG